MEAFFGKYTFETEKEQLRLANIKAYMIVHDKLKICGQTFSATIRNALTFHCLILKAFIIEITIKLKQSQYHILFYFEHNK